MNKLRHFISLCCLVGLLVCKSGHAQSTSTITYFHLDPAGTPLMATDEAGNVVWKETHLPYGEKVNNQAFATTNSIGFAGKPYDNQTGLSYMGARYYNPTLGRFTGVDPVGFDPSNLHSHNRYAYANNNPYKYVDPDGRSPVAIAWGALAIGLTGYSAYQGYQVSGWSGVAGALGDAGLSIMAGNLAGIVASSGKNVAINVAANAAKSARPILEASTLSTVRSGGRNANKVGPDPKAEGAHSTFKVDKEGKITNTATYSPNSKNPTGFDEFKRVDITGKPHTNPDGTSVATPHVKEMGERGVRPATPSEIPFQAYSPLN